MMNEELEAVLEAVDAALEPQAELLAEFLRDEGDNHSTTYTALVFALAMMEPADVLDLAFAGIVRAAKVKLAADAESADDV